MYIFLVIQFKNLSFLLDSNVSSISSMAVKNLKRAYLEFGPSVISPTIYVFIFPKPKRIWLYRRGSVAYFVS